MTTTVSQPVPASDPVAGPDRTADLVAASTTSIADPGPLGLGAFAMTTFVLSVFNAGLIAGAGLDGVVLPLALFYGGTAQLLAGMWEFKKANTFGALAFTSFGAFWLAFAAYAKYIAPAIAAGPNASQLGHVTGVFLLAWAIFTVYMTVASLRVSAAVAAVFVALSITFILLTIGAFGAHADITKAGGYAGLVTAALAWYGSFAGVTNSTFKKVVLPVFPLAR